MQAAKEYLSCEAEPGTGCECHYNGRSRHCRTFAYSHPEIPEYSVHDIVRIGSCKKKLQYFVDERFFSIDEVPDDVELGEAQANQVRAHKSGQPIIDHEKIRSALGIFVRCLERRGARDEFSSLDFDVHIAFLRQVRERR